LPQGSLTGKVQSAPDLTMDKVQEESSQTIVPTTQKSKTKASVLAPHNTDDTISKDNSTNTSLPPPLVLNERQKFLVFLKIFVHYIQKTRVISHRRHVQTIVKECLARHKQQQEQQPHSQPHEMPQESHDSSTTLGPNYYVSLTQHIQYRLRTELGEIHWARGSKCFYLYCLKKGIKFVSSS
jgi:hypothetical protein